MGDFSDIVRALRSIPGGLDRATKRGLRRGAAIVLKRAKGKLGTYQPAIGDYPAWSKLKAETVKRKHTSQSGRNKGKLTRAGKKYVQKHGSWGAGGNDDSPLVGISGHLRMALTIDDSELEGKGVAYVGVAGGSQEQGKGSPADYAATHEFGDASRNIPQRSFLRPALHESRGDIKEEVAKEIISELRGRWR
jgi:hypothetical protein